MHDVVPGVSFGYGRNVVFYRLTLPVALGIPEHSGTWTAVLKAGKSRAYETHGYAAAASVRDERTPLRGAIPFSVLVHSYSNLKMDTTIAQSHYEPGAKVTVSSQLTQSGIPLDDDCTVRAIVTDPRSFDRSIELTHVGSGMYEASLIAEQAGVYEVLVKADGLSLRDQPFTREQVRSASVWRGGNRIPSVPDETTDSGDKEQLCKLLSCLLNDGVISPELQKRMLGYGLDLEALAKCVAAACDEADEGSISSLLERFRLDYGKLLGTYRDVLDLGRE